MKRKIILITSILIVFIAFSFYIKQDKNTYNATIKDMNNFTIKDNARYIILYNSESNKYYLAEVLSYRLDNNLYYLGEEACNFKQIENDVIVLSTEEKIVYASGEYKYLSNEVYDIQTIGLLMISYDSKNHNMQILKRNSEEKCILEFKYYKDFIPVDLIET